jgi:hypothetical protein
MVAERSPGDLIRAASRRVGAWWRAASPGRRIFAVGAAAVLVAVIVVGAIVLTKDKPPSVDWAKYSPSVQGRINRLADEKDCSGLQDEFDTADVNDAATRSRTGEGNADLLAYIDYMLEKAGCY